MAESRNQQNYYVRGTYTHYNTDFASDIIHMADLGFKELSIEPVVAPPEARMRRRNQISRSSCPNTNDWQRKCWNENGKVRDATSLSITT